MMNYDNARVRLFFFVFCLLLSVVHKAGALVTDWVVGRIWEGGRRSGWFSINDGLQGKDTNTGSGLFCFNWYIKMVPSRGKKKAPPPPD